MSPWVAVQPEDKSWRGEGQLVWGPGPAVSHPGCGSQSTTQPDARPCLFPHQQNGDDETTYSSERLQV